MVDAPRGRRFAKRIAQIVATALEYEIKDPRVSMVTVTDVRVTGDLHDATVYYTVIGDSVDAEPDLAGAAAALASANGLLRSIVGARTGVRYTPTLTFVLDALPSDAHRLDEVLSRARDADAEAAAQAAKASPAGDPDPYRTPRTEDDEE